MIHINVTCDEPGCKAAISMGFDASDERFDELLVGLWTLGWNVNGGPAQRDMQCRCPAHAAKEAPCAT